MHQYSTFEIHEHDFVNKIRHEFIIYRIQNPSRNLIFPKTMKLKKKIHIEINYLENYVGDYR